MVQYCTLFDEQNAAGHKNSVIGIDDIVIQETLGSAIVSLTKKNSNRVHNDQDA